MQKVKSNKLSVYLIKPEYSDYSEIVKDGLESYEIEGVGVFYMVPSSTRPPSWLKDFFGNTLPEMKLAVASSRGLLLTTISYEDQPFTLAVAFGLGRHLMKDGVFEDRFGLRVVLNSVVRNSLRSIDKVSLGSTAKQSREQISSEGGADSFGIDIEQDLLSSATGRSKVSKLGKTISGKDSLAASVKGDVRSVSDFLVTCVERYGQEDYKDEFDWIDHIKDVRNTSETMLLNDELMTKINSGEFDRIWLVPPEIVDWADTKGFRHIRPKRGELVDDLAIQDLVGYIESDQITIAHLKGSKIFLISSASDDVKLQWPAYRCIYAEIDWDDRFFVLNNGKWYEIAKDFTTKVNADFAATEISDIDFSEYDPENNNEASYNKAISGKIPDSICMDGDLIYHGGGKSSIEFCDVFSGRSKLIHVKRYSGSSQLSHLFSQGVVSAELFASDSDFREALNMKLSDEFRLEDAQARPDPRDFEIVYGIISKSEKDLDIPFFSKVSLKNAKTRLRGFGYKVSIKKIPTKKAPDIDVLLEDL